MKDLKTTINFRFMQIIENVSLQKHVFQNLIKFPPFWTESLPLFLKLYFLSSYEFAQTTIS